MAKSVKVGEQVTWRSSGGSSTGVVLKKLTTPTQIKGHKVAASKVNPEYLVESAKSGGRAAHKARALTKV